MKIKLDKSKFQNIDNAFKIIKETPAQAALDMIQDNLKACFNVDFDVKIIPANDSFFVMSVFPEVSTMEKIIQACMSDKNIDAIKSLWEANKKWYIEIDQRTISNFNFSERELTAILLHEVGHIVCSTSLPNRISLILRYELIKSKSSTKMMIQDKIFAKILSLPILDACISDGKRDRNSIKEEIKADAFAKKMGYSKELESVLTKLINSPLYPKGGTTDDKMKKLAAFSLSNLEDFQARKDALAKKSLLAFRESCESPYINSILDDYMETVFNDNPESMTFSAEGSKVKYMQERADKDIEDGYFREFFIFGKKELKRIDPAELDYILVRTNEIKNENDKMMLLSYLHSKLDIVEYYIQILRDPHLSKKYRVPYTMEQLIQLKETLLKMRLNIISFKIPERNRNILVSWPSNYDG